MSRIQISQLVNVPSRWQGLAKRVKGTPSAIGLDVGSSLVKGVLMTRTSQGFKLLQTAAQAVSPGEPAQSGPAIQSVMQALKGDRDIPVVTAVGGSNAVLRSIMLPKMSAQELRAALSFEAEKYIPFKLDEIFLDFEIVGDRPGGRMEVLLAAARQELVNSHRELLRSAGVTPAVIDMEGIALANAWEVGHPRAARPAKPKPGQEAASPPDQKQEVIALVHVGERGTILVVLLGSLLQFTRESSIGGTTFTQALAQGLGIAAADAQAVKTDPGAKADQCRTLLQPLWDEWLNQCRISFDFYENQFGHRIERLVLGGGSARLPGFRQWVQEATELPTEEWNPLEGIAVEGSQELAERHRASLGVAVGLAARELA